ncbi:MAG: hypothetical protein GF375_07885, partial [Candidatus Omnitrophica bacterium]|nr:hypothetical protein [Candidatus Omnitrophota bacterium]MBD3269882.1 hypothetical protein [Candidatus Omnitrophota bacterium]
ELDLRRQETTKEEYEPVVGEEEGIVRSSQRKTEYFKGSAGGAAGVPGTQSNVTGVPGYPQAGGGQGSSDYTREEVITNYEINKELSHTSSMPGEVKKISISVILDGEFSPEKIQSIKQVVASGVGIREERGDSVVVESFNFDKTYMEEEAEASKLRDTREFRNLLIKAGAIILVVLIVSLFTLSMARHARVIRTAARKVKETQGKIPSPEPAEKGGAGKEEVVPAESIDMLRRQVVDIANKNPEKIARVIKGLVTGG